MCNRRATRPKWRDSRVISGPSPAQALRLSFAATQHLRARLRVAKIFRGFQGESRIFGVHASCIATLSSGAMRPGRLQVVIAVDFSVCADAAISDWLAVLLPRTSVIDLVHV